ncbi:PD-(D/E)XK nuclease family protein [Parafrankia sp. EUN1f]|uniref:PD-(D/E)XK nuclease family protein n=1 Tax=Parafrankia sp. EUN1f TaxID=102897 RepID=UPI0001C459B0|nr:PD-(D/E)XK nuclease family protein [Parafrankia sp. EUN1f]EFC86503.1 hypothetical protein FrEUN1fDRAFT_0398 [Parafrankia sp. EUN1f]
MHVTEERTIITRSYSQLSEWAQCGLKYRLHRIDRVERLPAPWLATGLAFHRTVELYETSGGMPPDAAVDVFIAEFDRELLAIEQRTTYPRHLWLYGGRGGVEADIERRRAQGPDMIRAYIDATLTSPVEVYELPDGSPAVEVPFVLPLWETETAVVRLVGAVDLVYVTRAGSVRVRDHKTGAKEPVGNRQLGIYGLAVEALFGEVVTEGDYYMAKKGAATPPIPLSGYTPEVMHAEFQALETALAEGVFLANPGEHCRACDVKMHCPIFQMKGPT